MAATASVSPWIPEDDLLLKNAVEAGASLEALAKGAVKFSRRFSIKDLRDRWHSLLYDPVVSAEASARLFEHELSASRHTLKRNNSGNSRGIAEVLAKRKAESVRRHYYARRRRIRSNPFGNGCIGGGGGFEEHMVLNNVPNHFGLRERGVEILGNGLPQMVRNNAAADVAGRVGTACNAGRRLNSFEDNVPDRVERKDCFRGFREDVPLVSVDERGKNDGGNFFKQGDVRKNIPHAFGDNLVDLGIQSSIEEMAPLQSLSFTGLFRTDKLETKPFSAFDSVNNEVENDRTAFKGCQRFKSPVSDSIASFHSMGFPTAPLRPFSSSGYDIVHQEPMLEGRHDGDGFSCSTAKSDCDFADISDCLLNLSNEDDFSTEANGNDKKDKSCHDNLNSLLLSSPKKVHENNEANVSEAEKLVSDACHPAPADASLSELDVTLDPLHAGHGVQHSVSYSEEIGPSSTLVPDPHSPELHSGAVYCTLNSEDPEVPCNDDFFWPKAVVSSVLQPILRQACDPASLPSNQKDSEQKLHLMNKEQSHAQHFAASQMVRPDKLPESGPGQPVVGCGVQTKFRDRNCSVVVYKHVKDAHVDAGQCKSANVMDGAQEKAINVKLEEMDAQATCGEHLPLHAEPECVQMASPVPVVDSPISDQEDFESDDDMPYFSDIEAMILEMDLCPYDQDSYINRAAVSYQSEDTKRTIVRLEKCAHSSLQRAIASQGALAILYGHHLKHYIKKAEVILGRATEDNDVDIDLAREGRANKISRRQASIKLERDGSFFLMNHGKSSVSVNGKEVATGQFMNLSSRCLIEIRGMSFVFEVNYKSVRQYLANIAKTSHEKNTIFEWSPGGFDDEMGASLCCSPATECMDAYVLYIVNQCNHFITL